MSLFWADGINIFGHALTIYGTSLSCHCLTSEYANPFCGQDLIPDCWQLLTKDWSPRSLTATLERLGWTTSSCWENSDWRLPVPLIFGNDFIGIQLPCSNATVVPQCQSGRPIFLGIFMMCQCLILNAFGGLIITSDASEIYNLPTMARGWSCPIWWFQAPPRWWLAAIPLIGYWDICCTKYFRLRLRFGGLQILGTRKRQDFWWWSFWSLLSAPQTFTCQKASMPNQPQSFISQHVSRFFHTSTFFNCFSRFQPIFFPYFSMSQHPGFCSTQVSVSELPKVEALGIELRQTSGYAAPVNVQTGELVRRAVQKRLGRWWEKWIYPLVN